MDLNIRFILAMFATITVALVVHEFAHAIVADKLGDDTPRRAGRLTLNPFVIWQAYPVGSVIVPLVSAAMGGMMAWAATPVNPAGVDRKWSLRQANFLISAAGPASNVLLAAIGIGLIYALFPVRGASWAAPLMFGGEATGLREGVLFMFVRVNIFLAVFNLVPVAPLDGHAMLASYAPRSWEPALQFLNQYGMIGLLLLVMYGGHIIGPIVELPMRLALSPLLAK